MITRPVLIVGAPRSGTSMLQKVLRNHPAFWSLPSESDMIWDRFCHPALHDWKSEALDAEALTEEDREEIRLLFEQYMRPASFWRPFERTNLIWGFRRTPFLRRFLRTSFSHLMPLVGRFDKNDEPRRLLEKTASNCFRLSYVDKVFPDAKIIYPTRDGRNAINSMINAWRHPDRFFTYLVPADLNIRGYEHGGWKFVLPPGWRNYVDQPLEKVCAFQWQSCNEHMLHETEKTRYAGRVMRVRLEDLIAEPHRQLAELSEFLELPFDDYFKSVADDLPVVNSPDDNVSPNKWRGENRELVESIIPMIEITMSRLGYEIT